MLSGKNLKKTSENSNSTDQGFTLSKVIIPNGINADFACAIKANGSVVQMTPTWNSDLSILEIVGPIDFQFENIFWGNKASDVNLCSLDTNRYKISQLDDLG